jgi:hypothetical protein
MRGSLALTLGFLLLSASLLAVGNSQVRAQADDIPDSVLITGSLIRGVSVPQTDPGRLTQLTNNELRTTLRGASIRAVGDDLHIDEFGCDGEWAHIGNRIPAYGRYFIRNNQLCIEATVGANYVTCARILRGETGRTFLQGVSQNGPATISPGEITIRRAETCTQR